MRMKRAFSEFPKVLHHRQCRRKGPADLRFPDFPVFQHLPGLSVNEGNVNRFCESIHHFRLYLPYKKPPVFRQAARVFVSSFFFHSPFFRQLSSQSSRVRRNTAAALSTSYISLTSFPYGLFICSQLMNNNTNIADKLFQNSNHFIHLLSHLLYSVIIIKQAVQPVQHSHHGRCHFQKSKHVNHLLS